MITIILYKFGNNVYNNDNGALGVYD